MKSRNYLIFILLVSIAFSGCRGRLRDTTDYSTWPERPITITLGQGAGGGTDMVIRALAVEMERILGTTISVVNQPGASGSLAIESVLQRPADGYWLQGNSGFNKIARIMGHTESVPWQDWSYFRLTYGVPSFSVRADSPIRDMAHFVQLARANPGQYTISNSGVGGIWHEANVVFANGAGIDLRHVPFTSGAESTLAVLRGDVDVSGAGIFEQWQFIEEGSLRILGIFSMEPVTLTSGMVMPRIMDSLPEFEALGTFGAEHHIAVRRDTPPEIISRLGDAIRQAMETESFRSFARDQWLTPGFMYGEETDRRAAYSESLTAWLYFDIGLEGVNRSPAELNPPVPRLEDFDRWWPPAGYRPVAFN